MFKNPVSSFFCELVSFLSSISNQTGLFQSLGHPKKTAAFINSCTSSGSNRNLSVNSSSDELRFRSRTSGIRSCGKRSQDDLDTMMNIRSRVRDWIIKNDHLTIQKIKLTRVVEAAEGVPTAAFPEAR
jgi:hypothetical protein